MGKKFPVLVFIFLFSLSGILSAEQLPANPGSGNRGLFLSVGYHGNNLDYREYVNGGVLDKDSGWENGIAAEARFEAERISSRALFEFSGSDNALYEGADAITNTPITLRTRERFYRYEADLGYKLLNFRAATLTPYIGIGYWEWRRGRNALPDYLEKYTWYYLPIGLNYVYRNAQWTIGADATVYFPFSMKMETDIAGTADNAAFDLKSRPGFRAEFPATYDIYRPKAPNRATIFFFATPYYQYWEIGRSDNVTLTSNGVPADIVYEPKSKTGILGFKAGLGINF